jgi:hypothetical protein
VPDAGRAVRRRRRNYYTPVRVDSRTGVGKRTRELREHYRAALVSAGRELTVDLAMKVDKAAELMALCESMRANMLRGVGDVCADDMVRMQRLADASVRQLGLQAAPAKPTASLRERIVADEVSP